MDASKFSNFLSRAVILCVDDEPNVLTSLQRLLRREKYNVLTAESATQGLHLLEQQNVDLVISDMRMPEIDGAQFLESVRKRWPDTMRVLLTGFADIGATITAINHGEIYRYISKPWDDNDVLLLVKHALEHKFLAQEKQRLELLTHQQNEQLKALNAGLESKVQERTQELQRALNALEVSNDQLKRNFITSVAIFSNLMELRAGSLGGHSRRVADFSRKLAVQMGLGKDEIQDIVLAALLHDIGKIGLSDSLLEKPQPQLTHEEQAEMMRHPQIAETALMPLEQLKNAAAIIRSHHERFDGDGFPDGLSGFNIPLGARIIALANDFDAIQHGTMLSAPLSPAKAYEFILEFRGSRYDPSVVEAFKNLLGGDQAHEEVAIEMHTKDLKPGMTLARGVFTREGLLLLFKDVVLTDKIIEQMLRFETLENHPLTFWVRPKTK